MRDQGLTRIELGLSLIGPFLVLAIAAGMSGWVAIALLVGVLGGLGFAAVFGVDSRDGRDW